MRIALALAMLCVASPAHGQLINPPVITAAPPVDTSNLATKAQVDAAKAVADAAAATAANAATKTQLNAIAATIPVPASVVPPTEMIGGSVGAAGTYRPADAANPRITRAGTVTTSAATGDWSITWTMPLAATPVVLPIPINNGTEPIVCNVATRTMNGAAGRCWLSRTLPATLLSLTTLVSYNLFGAPATGIQVQILAIPPTQ